MHCWSHEGIWTTWLMMFVCVVFGEVICQISDARHPEYMKMFLINAIPYTVKLHIDGTGALLFDVFVGNNTSDRILDLPLFLFFNTFNQCFPRCLCTGNRGFGSEGLNWSRCLCSGHRGFDSNRM